MPVSYTIDQGLGVVRLTISGTLNMDEVLAYFEALEQNPARRGTFDTLIDLRSLQAVLETGQVRGVVDRIAALPSAIRFGACAIVANDPLSEGAGRLFVAVAGNTYRAMIVVSSLEEAEAWLRSQKPPRGLSPVGA